MKEFLKKLQEIERANDDRFFVAIGARLRGGEVHYTLEVTEATEGHVILLVSSAFFEDLSERALRALPEACADISYVYPK